MYMYDTSINVAYETDDEYRECLLSVFGLKEYSSELVEKIEAVVEEHPALLERVSVLKSEFSMDFGSLILFSFDHFKETHLLLVGTKPDQTRG